MLGYRRLRLTQFLEGLFVSAVGMGIEEDESDKSNLRMVLQIISHRS